MSLEVLTIIGSACWSILAAGALLYQFDYYLRTRSTHTLLSAAMKAELDRVSMEIVEAPAEEVEELLRERRIGEGGLASIQVSYAKASSLVWVHAFLTGVGFTALTVAVLPVTPTTTATGILLASLGSIVLTGRLVWLTWYSNARYQVMRVIVAEDRADALAARLAAIERSLPRKRGNK